MSGPSVPLRDQIREIGELARRIHASLQVDSSKYAPQVIEDINCMQYTLAELSTQVSAFEEQRTKMLALAVTAQAVNSSLEIGEVLQLVMDTIVRLTEAERGFLMLREQGAMVMRVARNWEQESINPGEFAISRTVVERVLESGEAVLTTNAQEDPRFGGQESIVAYNLRSILCVPLKARSELIGVIYADNRIRSGIFTAAERDLLLVFADQAAVAIENARLFASVRNALAEVTGLKNLMDDVFSSIASGVLTADVEEKITLCNRAAEGILDQVIPDLVGHRLEEALPGLTTDLRQHLTAVRETDKPVIGLELSQHLPRRGTVDWRLSLSPLKDADQTTQGVAIVLDDLTERKKLEGQRRLLERMVSPAVLDEIDPDSLQRDHHPVR
jgi:adenylate cyclase